MARVIKDDCKEIQTVLPVENALEKVEVICQVTATNFSSMALDRMNNRMTEIDGIVLPILEKGSHFLRFMRYII